MTLTFYLMIILCPLVSRGLHYNDEFIEKLGLNRRTFSTLYRDLQNTYPRLRNAYLASPLANQRPKIKNNKRKRPHPCRGCNHKGHASYGKLPTNPVYFTDFVPIENPYQFVPPTESISTGYLSTQEHPALSYFPPSTTRRPPQRPHHKHSPYSTTTTSTTTTTTSYPSKYPLKYSVNSIPSSTLAPKKTFTLPQRHSSFSNTLKQNPSGYNIEIDHSNGYSYVFQSLGSSNKEKYPSKKK
nr:uncharacterized protein LOC121122128 [Lepeophtheirus salmonis]